MTKWECLVCGYVYDPAVGDPDNGVAPGTAFEDIPDDWVCPSAGQPRTCSKSCRANTRLRIWSLERPPVGRRSTGDCSGP